jgi:hypothetical protein
MEVYILDSLLRRSALVDRYQSLIWTERFSAYGDFELVLQSTKQNRGLFKTGTRIATNNSHRVMTVETVEDGTDSEGRDLLIVKGRSLEQILEDRVAKDTMADLTEDPRWVITDPPADVARKIFHDICVLGTLDLDDIIPFVIEGSLLPESTIAEPLDPITVELDPKSVYDAIKDICDVWGLGFRMLRNYDTSELYFDVYSGSDRTTGQTELDPVVFAPGLDNLQNTKSLTSIADYKNVAYVFSPAGSAIVFPLDVDPEVEGFERRVLVVNASDITAENPDVEAALQQRGLEELSKHRTFQAFDGEIQQSSQYKYGTHYQLGDLVEMRNSDGATNQMRVTEQIFVSDAEGERSYPTLTIALFINAGSWLSWPYNQVWEDLGETEYWADQP